MRILVTNDDGIYSPGLQVLATAAAKFGSVQIVAPDLEQSSVAHAITSSRPLSYRRVRVGGCEALRVNGTPADCVGLGLVIWDGVDVVFSGLNLGLNVGNSMWHSATLAAAKQVRERPTRRSCHTWSASSGAFSSSPSSRSST